MDQQHTPPTLAEVQGTLDELATAARSGEADRYRVALRVAKRQALTEEQISDTYRWDAARQEPPRSTGTETTLRLRLSPSTFR